MYEKPIRTWHVVISGWLQNEGQPTGMVRLWRDLHARFTARRVRVELRVWNDRWDALAEFIWRLRSQAPVWPFAKPRIVIYGYSWGGYSAVVLARLLQRRGLPVEHLVLSDAVYRHWYLLGQWRALLPGSRIVVPSNVKEVTWFRQGSGAFKGHDVVAVDARKTKIHPAKLAKVHHRYMDDLRAFHAEALAIAGKKS